MNSKKWIYIAIGSSLALAVLFGAAATYRAVNAQAATSTPAAPSAQPGSTLPGPKEGIRGWGYDEQQLATALGITVDKLQVAEQTAMSEALKQAVADGAITQSQADQLSQRAANGRGLEGIPFLQDSKIDYNALLAQALGITTDKLQAARQTATYAALDQAVADGTLTQTQADAEKARYALANSTKFQEAMNSAFKSAVQQAVTDGLITQAQADALLNSMNGQFGWGVRGGFGFGRHGGPGGRGGPGGGWGFDTNGGSAPLNPPSSAPTTAPSGSGL